MTFLLIAALIAAMILLYTTDRVLKAFSHARRYRAMSERLDAATDRTEAQQERQKKAAAASAELTFLMPAISRPPLTIPGMRQSEDSDGEAGPGPDAPVPAKEAAGQAATAEETAQGRPLRG
jgi:hypothetical protein